MGRRPRGTRSWASRAVRRRSGTTRCGRATTSCCRGASPRAIPTTPPATVRCRPAPARGSIPIWIGGHTPRALRRVAELGDGWHAAFPTAAALKDGLAHLRAACSSAGRDPKTLTVSARLGLPGKKPSAELLADVKALRDLGVDHVILEPAARDLASMTGAIERFAGEVRARL